MSFITISADTKKIERRLRILSNGVSDFRKPLKDSADLSKKLFEGNFPKQGTEFKKWKNLSPATIAAKVRMGFSRKPLIATGKLRKGFKTLKLTRFFAVVSNKVKYYKYHQTGTKRLPKRQMIFVNRKLSKKISKIFGSYLKTLLKK